MKVQKEWSKDGKTHVLHIRYTNRELQSVSQSFRGKTKKSVEKEAMAEVGRYT